MKNKADNTYPVKLSNDYWEWTRGLVASNGWMGDQNVLLPGGLSHIAVQIPTAVTGIRDFQQVLVIFKYLNRSSKTKEHFVIMFNRLTKTWGGEEDFRCMQSVFRWRVRSQCSDLQWLKYFSSPAPGWRPSVSELSGRHPQPSQPLTRSQMSLVWPVSRIATTKTMKSFCKWLHGKTGIWELNKVQI